MKPSGLVLLWLVLTLVWLVVGFSQFSSALRSPSTASDVADVVFLAWAALVLVVFPLGFAIAWVWRGFTSRAPG